MKTLDLQNLDAELTRRMNQIAKDNQEKYTEFVDSCSKKYKNDLFWWLTPFASRNLYMSSSFQNFCKILLAKEIIDDDKELILIVVGDKAYKHVLRQYICRQKKDIKISVRKKKNKKKGFVYAIYIFMDIWRKEFRNYLKIRRLIKNQIYRFDKPICLIDTYVLTSRIKDGHYRDRYFENILKYTNENVFFCPTVSFDDNTSLEQVIFELLHCTDYKFILKEVFLKKRDYFKCFLYLLKVIKFCNSNKKYGELNFTRIVNCDLIHGLRNLNTMIGMLNYYFMKNLLNANIPIKKLVGWYEGQPSSIGLFAAYQKISGKEAVGYIGFPLFDILLFSVSPSALQSKMKMSPAVVGIIGSYYSTTVSQFNKNQKYEILPAFRNTNLYSKFNGEVEKKKEILVVLSYFKPSSVNLILMINQIFTKEMGYKLIFKNHPTNSAFTLSDYGVEAGNYEYGFVNGNLMDHVLGKSLVLAADTSSGLEIMANGVPLILCEELNTITFRPMLKEVFDGICGIAYNVDELKTQIERLLEKKYNKEDFKQYRQYILEKMFTDANEQTVARCFAVND